jgi:hypothetical protein
MEANASTLVLLPIAVSFYCSGQLRPGFLGIVQRFCKGVPVTGSESDHLFFRQDLPGSFLGGAEQESAYRHPCGRGRPDNQLLDFRRCAQINAFVGLGNSRHDRLAFITEEIRHIVVRCETARNSNRTIDVLVAKIDDLTKRREMAGSVSSPMAASQNLKSDASLRAQALRSTHLPLEIANRSLSLTRAWKEISLPSRHISTVSVWPGSTGELKRA